MAGPAVEAGILPTELLPLKRLHEQQNEPLADNTQISQREKLASSSDYHRPHLLNKIQRKNSAGRIENGQ